MSNKYFPSAASTSNEICFVLMDLIDEFVYIFCINYVKIRQSFLHIKILPMKWNEIFYI